MREIQIGIQHYAPKCLIVNIKISIEHYTGPSYYSVSKYKYHLKRIAFKGCTTGPGTMRLRGIHAGYNHHIFQLLRFVTVKKYNYNNHSRSSTTTRNRILLLIWIFFCFYYMHNVHNIPAKLDERYFSMLPIYIYRLYHYVVLLDINILWFQVAQATE